MRRGLSLIEVLVGMALFGMLVTATVKILVPALRAWVWAGARGDMENEMLVTVRQLTRHLELTDVATVALLPQDGASNGVVYATVDAQAAGLVYPDCSIMWKGYEAWYVDNDPQSSVTGFALFLQTEPHVFTPSQMRSYPFQRSQGGKVMLRNVVSFNVSATANPPFNAGPVICENPIQFSLVSRTDHDVQTMTVAVTCHLNQDLEPFTAGP